MGKSLSMALRIIASEPMLSEFKAVMLVPTMISPIASPMAKVMNMGAVLAVRGVGGKVVRIGSGKPHSTAPKCAAITTSTHKSFLEQ